MDNSESPNIEVKFWQRSRAGVESETEGTGAARGSLKGILHTPICLRPASIPAHRIHHICMPYRHRMSEERKPRERRVSSQTKSYTHSPEAAAIQLLAHIYTHVHMCTHIYLRVRYHVSSRHVTPPYISAAWVRGMDVYRAAVYYCCRWTVRATCYTLHAT